MTARKPNLVLIVADDHGREALGCYGNRAIHTPHLDTLAADGVRFTNSFCTSASCAASRSVILTGMHNHANGTYGHTHGHHHFSCMDGVRTLPLYLKACGYRTGRLGKKHYAPEALFPFDFNPPEWEFGRDDVRMAEAARAFVKDTSPFFLYWCSHNPHRDAVIQDHPLRPDNFGNPKTSFPGDTETLYRDEDVIIPSFLNDTPEARAELSQYYQSIARLDRGVGALLRMLKETGSYDSTVIIYISDNGAAFPQAKTTLYDPGMRLPCIVRAPEISQRGGTCDGLITWADITPTLLDFAGADYELEAFHGRSFRGIISEAMPTNWRDEVFASHTFHEITNYYPMRVLRTKKYKFIYNIAWKLDYSFASDLWDSASWQEVVRNNRRRIGARSRDAYEHRPRFELYDLETDPDETINLAEQPEHRSLVDAFCRRLKQFQESTRDPWVHKWTYE